MFSITGIVQGINSVYDTNTDRCVYGKGLDERPSRIRDFGCVRAALEGMFWRKLVYYSCTAVHAQY